MTTGHYRRDSNGVITDGDSLCNFSYYFGAVVDIDGGILPRGKQALQTMRKELCNDKIPPKGLDFQRNAGLSSPNAAGMVSLLQTIGDYSAVTRLNLERCSLQTCDAKAIATQLQRFGVMPNLSALVLRHNNIDPGGGIAIADLVKSGKVRQHQSTFKHAVG